MAPGYCLAATSGTVYPFGSAGFFGPAYGAGPIGGVSPFPICVGATVAVIALEAAGIAGVAS